MDADDLYEILQVDPRAEFEVIRAAYRILAAKHHPDAGGSHQEMTRLNAAWTVLSDPQRRAAYDRERRLRVSGDRWDAAVASRPGASRRASGTILDFGRYAGWSIPEVADRDPDFLEWLARTPAGRRYRREIDAVLTSTRAEPAPRVNVRPRRRFARG